jgi:ABC-type nitrate/sulfonate/bicarbonate transport system substrate-binding protein
MKSTKARLVRATAIAAVLTLVFGASAMVRAAELTFGLPAIPPIFVDVQAIVAGQQGFFKKYGVDVKLRNFPNGSEASRAVAAGDAALSLSPTPLVINQVANAGVNVVGIYGNEHPDYYLVAVDSNASCKSVAGQPVGVDAPGGALSVALKYMLKKCNITLQQVQQIGLSANVPTAMFAGLLMYAVLLLDGLLAVDGQSG